MVGTGSEWMGKACAAGRPLGLMRTAIKKVSFAPTTTGLAGSGKELFTVGGTVGAVAFGVCDTALNASGVAVIKLGTATASEHFISGTTATTIDDDEIWVPGTPAKGILYSGIDARFAILHNTDIGYNVATAAIWSGTMTFYCFWWPISDGAWVEPQETANTVL